NTSSIYCDKDQIYIYNLLHYISLINKFHTEIPNYKTLRVNLFHKRKIIYNHLTGVISMTMKKLLATGAISTIPLLGACGESDETDVTEPQDPDGDVEQEDRGEDISEEEGEDLDDSSTE